jgi:hypothetical protein
MPSCAALGGGRAILLRCNFLALAVAGLLGCLGGLGCGSSGAVPTPVQAGGTSYLNLRTIKSAYLQATKALGRPPQNLDEIKPYFNKGTDPATILRSPDDGEEYKILWGVDVMNAEPINGQLPVVAYEQRGKDGKRYVLQVRDIRQVTNEDFKKLPFPPG